MERMRERPAIVDPYFDPKEFVSMTSLALDLYSGSLYIWTPGATRPLGSAPTITGRFDCFFAGRLGCGTAGRGSRSIDAAILVFLFLPRSGLKYAGWVLFELLYC
jgi:hypothetical protein